MYNYEPHKRWEKGCSCQQLSAKFLGISTIFQHMPNQSILHTHSAESEFYIVSRLSKSLFSGIFKSWSDHHNTLYFYVHILYQIVGFIHYKDGINKRRWIKRSFIVEIVLDLASALKSHSQTKNTLNSVPLLTLLSATWSWSNQFFTILLKHYPSKILLKHYQSKIVKKNTNIAMLQIRYSLTPNNVSCFF